MTTDDYKARTTALIADAIELAFDAGLAAGSGELDRATLLMRLAATRMAIAVGETTPARLELLEDMLVGLTLEPIELAACDEPSDDDDDRNGGILQ